MGVNTIQHRRYHAHVHAHAHVHSALNKKAASNPKLSKHLPTPRPSLITFHSSSPPPRRQVCLCAPAGA